MDTQPKRRAGRPSKGPAALNNSMSIRLSREMADDFVGISGLADIPFVVVTTPTYKSMKDVIAAGGKPGMAVEYYYSSNGTTDGVQAQFLQKAWEQNLGIKIDRLNPQIQDLAVAGARPGWIPSL